MLNDKIYIKWDCFYKRYLPSKYQYNASDTITSENKVGIETLSKWLIGYGTVSRFEELIIKLKNNVLDDENLLLPYNINDDDYDYSEAVAAGCAQEGLILKKIVFIFVVEYEKYSILLTVVQLINVLEQYRDFLLLEAEYENPDEVLEAIRPEPINVEFLAEGEEAEQIMQALQSDCNYPEFNAYISIKDPETGDWIAKNAPTAMFPESWLDVQMDLELDYAVQNATPHPYHKGMWQGRSLTNLLIEGYYADDGGMATAFPVYLNVKTPTPKKAKKDK